MMVFSETALREKEYRKVLPLKDINTMKKVLEPLRYKHAGTTIGKSSIIAALNGKLDFTGTTMNFPGASESSTYLRLDDINSIVLKDLGGTIMLDVEFFDKRRMQIHARGNMPKAYYSLLDTLQDG